MGSIVTHIATGVTAVVTASLAAMMATVIYGMTSTVTLFWAAVAVPIATTSVTVTQAVTAWRRAYWLGQYHACTNAVLVRRQELASAEK